MQLNTEVNFFDGQVPGEYIVHLPLLGTAFKAPSSAIKLIQKLKDNNPLSATELVSKDFQSLIKLNLIGDGKYDVPKIDWIDTFNPVEGTLILTETCNMGCAYCYASSAPAKSKPMTFEIAAAAVDTVIKNASLTNSRHASFRYIGGGEPTIEWNLLKQITEYIKRQADIFEVSYFIRLITNGTLLTGERINWIAANLQFITLSFDILPELHSIRPYANGKSTQEKLLEVCRLLKEKGVKFHLRTTITTEGASRLSEMIRYTYNVIGAESVRFEPLSEVGRAVDTLLNKPLQEVFVEEFKKAYILGQQLGIDVTCKMTKNLKRRGARFCEAEFSVGPSGSVSACHRYSRDEHVGFDLFQYGEYIDSSFVFNMDKLNNVRMIDVHNYSDCKSCIAKYNCAGGCLSARISKEGISETGPLCHLTRELLKFSIINELEKI